MSNIVQNPKLIQIMEIIFKRNLSFKNKIDELIKITFKNNNKCKL